ncbi:tRNA preQ1(34) S-adenosylmethionine ribosyltransferase-isomerase QueA [bacterium]|nr:tRNA preQ1(34) S-adenosylmethionine ribosyltransferase-isomerase QueA [bacterium]
MSTRLEDYDYELPEELIAQRPVTRRDESRLLVLDGKARADHNFRDLPSFLRRGDLLVLNNTRVMPARLLGCREGGEGAAELLLHSPTPQGDWIALVRPSKRFKPGMRFFGEDGVTVRVEEDLGEGNRRVVLESPNDWMAAMQTAGAMPLPPYIRRKADSRDAERYQTVFARENGAVAAPTAGLHFSEEVLHQIAELGVDRGELTLHVGPGTFLPVREVDFSKHRMHAERFELDAALRRKIDKTREAGGRVIAVGTTVVRALESLSETDWAGDEDHQGETRLFVHPPYEFKRVDALLTNFHLPRSTLLMLVSALAGREAMLAAYEHAVREKYRFYSYGDAMLIMPGGLT